MATFSFPTKQVVLEYILQAWTMPDIAWKLSEHTTEYKRNSTQFAEKFKLSAWVSKSNTVSLICGHPVELISFIQWQENVFFFFNTMASLLSNSGRITFV